MDVTSVVINILALVSPLYMTFKEKHYVKRSTAVFNGLTLIAVGIAIMLTSNIWIGIVPTLIGFLVISLTTTRDGLGTIIGSSLVTLIILVLILLAQIGL